MCSFAKSLVIVLRNIFVFSSRSLHASFCLVWFDSAPTSRCIVSLRDRVIFVFSM